MSEPGATITLVTEFEDWRAAREAADAQAAAAAHDVEAQLTALGPGFWMVTLSGMTRGFITQIRVGDEERFEARLRHINPGQGTRIGEYWELQRAVEAILAESPKFVGSRDPFAELTRYASRDDMRARTERLRLQRRSRRYADEG